MYLFAELQRSGLPINWSTVQAGWTGFGNFPRQLTNEDVISYALALLQQNDDDLVLALASAYANDNDDLWRCLHALVTHEDGEVGVEQRKWRWVAVRDLLNAIERAIPISEDDLTYAVGDLYLFWDDWGDQQLRKRLLGENAYNAGLEALLARHQQWLAEEYEFLKNWTT